MASLIAILDVKGKVRSLSHSCRILGPLQTMITSCWLLLVPLDPHHLIGGMELRGGPIGDCFASLQIR